LAGAKLSNAPFEDIPFDREELTALYLGCRITESDRQEILRLAADNYPKIEVFIGSKSAKSFSLEFNPPPSP